MINSRTPRVAGDFAESIEAGVRLVLYMAATPCYLGTPGKRDLTQMKKGRKKERDRKKDRISIYKSMREYLVALPGRKQALLTCRLPLHN